LGRGADRDAAASDGAPARSFAAKDPSPASVRLPDRKEAATPKPGAIAARRAVVAHR